MIWLPKYRTKVLQGERTQSLEHGLGDIATCPPDMDIETWSIQVDHSHLVSVMPPTYAVSAIVGKSKAHTSRESRQCIGQQFFGHLRA